MDKFLPQFYEWFPLLDPEIIRTIVSDSKDQEQATEQLANLHQMEEERRAEEKTRAEKTKEDQKTKEKAKQDQKISVPEKKQEPVLILDKVRNEALQKKAEEFPGLPGPPSKLDVLIQQRKEIDAEIERQRIARGTLVAPTTHTTQVCQT